MVVKIIKDIIEHFWPCHDDSKEKKYQTFVQSETASPLPPPPPETTKSGQTSRWKQCLALVTTVCYLYISQTSNQDSSKYTEN